MSHKICHLLSLSFFLTSPELGGGAVELEAHICCTREDLMYDKLPENRGGVEGKMEREEDI